MFKTFFHSWFKSTFIRSYSNMNNIIATNQGKLRGQIKTLSNGETYASFKGIPYAQPPIGKMRFKAPLPPEPWIGVRDAIEHGPICPQYDLNTQTILDGDENCLFLNVYSKCLTPTNGLAPVFFWIHGGGYLSGSGNSDLFGPEYLLQHNVVVVTINYRLEVLGFLCLDNEDVPGNAGLKDQVAALKWVKENISNFGGDPNNITLAGESAGATSATFHAVSPMSRGFYHKIIAQSGVPLCDWAYSNNGKARAIRLGKLLGKETTDMKELLEFLQSVPATNLTKTTFRTMTSDEKIRGLPLHFSPIVEKKFENVEPFVTENFLNLLHQGKIEYVPFLMGYNTAEGILGLQDTLKKKDFINKNFHCKVPREIFESVPKSKSDEFGERIRKYYLRGEDISYDKLNEVCKMNSDLLFVFNCHRFADIYSKLNKHSTFVYMFSCVTELNLVKRSMGLMELDGASHADDLFYLFKTSMFEEEVENNMKLKELIYRITKMWTNFAKTGNPTPDEEFSVKWEPYNSNTKSVLIIGDELKTSQPDLKALNFLKKIYAEAGCVVPNNKL